MSLLSGREVVANDIRRSMCDAVAQEAMRLRELGALVRVRPLAGDICALIETARLRPGNFDLVISNQTIEHVHDLRGMLETCHRLLRPGGRVVLTNDNNIHHPRGLAEAQSMWRRRDRDWDYIRELQQSKPQEMAGIEPFAETRRRLIREASPARSEAQVEQLVSATAGLVAPEIRELAVAWNGSDPLPTPPVYAWCRDPESGEYVERQLDPFALLHDLRKAGFGRVRLRHAYRRWPLRLLNRSISRATDKLLFRLKPGFVLVGEKSR